jgi:Secretion system C-terminal sorting domain
LENEKRDPASGNMLNNISAHRDGTCATNCPGDNLYPKLQQIRQKTLQSCDFAKPLAFEDDLDLLPKVYPNPVNNRVWVSVPNTKTELYLFDGMGREVSVDRQEEKENRSYSFSTDKFSKGIYFLKIGDKTSKLIIE